MVGMFHIAIRNPATENVGSLMVIYRLDEKRLQDSNIMA
jgi:hypothetical protein